MFWFFASETRPGRSKVGKDSNQPNGSRSCNTFSTSELFFPTTGLAWIPPECGIDVRLSDSR
jgi:hypothetical protein